MTLAPPPMRPAAGGRRRKLSQPYWEACAKGELVVQRCSRCRLATYPAAHVCPRCRVPELVWTPSRLTGAVYTFTTVWRPVTPDVPVPYVLAWIDMDDGWQLLAPIVGCEPSAVAIGRRVVATFAELRPNEVLPVFELTDESLTSP